MNDNCGEKEPSMEEILSSIRKIISEDTNDRGAVEDSITEPLELSDEVEYEEKGKHKLVDNSEEEPLELKDEIIDFSSESGSVALPPVGLELSEEQVVPGTNNLLSPEVAAASKAALSQLSQSLSGHDVPLGRADQTLEQMVKELVRPMLREWLEDNLPTVVEDLVRREIKRIVKVAQAPD